MKLIVDPISIRYLIGAEVDFDDFKGGFTVKNPNAKSTCGCGQSFTTEKMNNPDLTVGVSVFIQTISLFAQHLLHLGI